MSNINILDHDFYFKTQRGRIKSQPINSEVSHYHLRLLLGSKEAPWWWPLKAPYGVFASLGRKIKAWVRGVGFLMFPLEWWSSSQGLTGCVGWRNGSPRHGAGCEGVHSGPSALLLRVTPGEPGGMEGWIPKCAPGYPCSSWLHEGQVHMWRGVLIHLTSATCGWVSFWSETKQNGRWKPHWHLLKAGGTLKNQCFIYRVVNPN